MRRATAATLGWLLVTSLLVWPAMAQADEPPATQPKPEDAEFAAKQRYTRDQFVKLTTKMIEVADLLEKTEPQTAKVIREAVSQAQKAFIAEDMDKVAEYLEKGVASAAVATEDEVIRELRRVLDTLRHGILDLDQRLERIKQWKEFLNKIEDLIKKQTELKTQSNLTHKADEFNKQADELSKRLSDIVAEQKDLKARTGKLPSSDPDLEKLLGLRREVRDIIDRQTALRKVAGAAAMDKLPITGQIQKQLGDRTGKLAGQLAEAAGAAQGGEGGGAKGGEGGKLAAAAGNAREAAGEMSKAADALGKSDAAKAADPQDQALIDLKKAEQALDDAIAKKAGGSPAADLAGKQDDLAKKTGELASAVDQFAKETGAGGGKPSAGQGEGKSGEGKSGEGKSGEGKSGEGKSGEGKSGEGQSSGSKSSGSPSGGQKSPAGNLDKAADHMKNAAGELGDQKRDEALDQQQKALDELEAKKYELAQLKRRIAEKASTPLKQQAGEQSETADRTDKVSKQMKNDGDTPGQKSVASASKSMGSASGQLSKGKPGEANQDQKKALDDLAKAREELADAVEQEQDLAQAEQLAKIDQMLQKILDRQVALSATTRETYDKRTDKAPEYARGEQLKLAELSDGEGRLAEEIRKIRDMLLKEGTTVVFPTVLKEVHDDLQDVQNLLARKDPGPYTQGVQKEVEQSLREMISSIRDELAERRKKQQGGGGGGGGGGGRKPPLVPPIAELKMLRQLQITVNRRTVTLNEETAGKKLPAKQAEAEHKKLGERQESVRKMTQELKDKLNQGGH